MLTNSWLPPKNKTLQLADLIENVSDSPEGLQGEAEQPDDPLLLGLCLVVVVLDVSVELLLIPGGWNLSQAESIMRKMDDKMNIYELINWL